MKTIRVKFVGGLAACSVLLSALSQGLLAQQTSDQSQAQESQQQQGARQSEASKKELKVSQQEMSKEVTDINKASKLTGMQVKNREGETLGKIHDLVVDPQSGKVAYAVLSSGGVFGVGGKLIAVPLEAFTAQPGQEHLVLDISKKKLEQASGFSQNNWPNLDAAQTGKTIGLAPAGKEQKEPAGAEQKSKEAESQEKKGTSGAESPDASKGQEQQEKEQEPDSSNP